MLNIDFKEINLEVTIYQPELWRNQNEWRKIGD